MHVLVTGGRDYHLTDQDRPWLKALHAMHTFTEVIQGGASGADRDARTWAEAEGIPVTTFHANWTGEGKAAGPKRNARMVSYGWLLRQHGAEVLVIGFPGGAGTANCLHQARQMGFDIVTQEA